MTGESVPYHLRPHKAVDRRLFLDLLSRFERWRPLSEYVYLSMGAYPLEDHKLVHRLIGITRLIAFDFDDAIVARQMFNRPIETCHCLHKKSGDLISDLDKVLSECAVSPDRGFIVWLDYTDPSKIGQQLREFEALLNRLREGDLVRVTVNAHPHDLIDQQAAGGKPLAAEVKRQKQFDKLKERISDYLPSWAKPEHMTSSELPHVLSAAFASAALKALPVSESWVFAPLSIIRYADGQQMLSITGSVVDRTNADAMRERLGLSDWPFSSTGWDVIHHLVVPHLTVRERLFLEREITSKAPDDLIKELGFETASGVAIADFLDSYKNYYRFYPTLLTSEL